jgi:hypothetical protein
VLVAQLDDGENPRWLIVMTVLPSRASNVNSSVV